MTAGADETAGAAATPSGILTGTVRHAQFVEDRFVEVVCAVQQRVEPAEEPARIGALDDAVIVGAGDHHHLADPELSARFRRRTGILGGIIHGAGCNDRALPHHQPRNRAERADGTGIRQRNRRALKIGRHQLAGACAGDDVVERGQVLPERQSARRS